MRTHPGSPTLDEIARRLTPALAAAGAVRAIIFGSHARGEADAWRIGHREGFHSKVCFLCQQGAEKGLKALAYAEGARFVPGHSLQELLDRLRPAHPVLDEARDIGRLLDQYYIPTRYPNALPGGVPHRAFTEVQAREALAGCERILDTVRAEIGRMRSQER